MSEFKNPFLETEKLFEERLNEIGYGGLLNVTIISNDKQKDLFKVSKANPTLKFRTNDDVIIMLNERIFEQLTDEQRLIVVDEALAGVHYDMEKEKLTITKPDVVTYSGLLSKYGFDKWEVLRQSLVTLYSAQGQEEDEAEAETVS